MSKEEIMNALCTMLVLFVCFTSAAFAQNEAGERKESMKPALVIIDIQNEYLPQMSEEEKKFALHVINGAIWFFRQNNLPIIRVYHSDVRWGPEEGTENFEYPKTVHVRDTDIKIHKHDKGHLRLGGF